VHGVVHVDIATGLRPDAEVAGLFFGDRKNEMTRSLETAIADMKVKLPGWWFTVGECSVSCDATVGPDIAHCPKWMLEAFDDGIDNDLRQPSTLVDALDGAVEKALKAIHEVASQTT
jgi:hypothetical protein